jgi:serine/threonine protein kinase
MLIVHPLPGGRPCLSARGPHTGKVAAGYRQTTWGARPAEAKVIGVFGGYTMSTARSRAKRHEWALRLYDELHPVDPDHNELYSGLLPGGNIAGFVYERRIGEGGQATIVRVRELGSGRRYAMRVFKIPPAHALPRAQHLLTFTSRIRHPAVPVHHRVGTLPGGYVFLLLDFIPGQKIVAFADYMHLTVRRRLNLFQRLCRAVSRIHEHGLCHCDLKPDNVLVTPDHRPHIIDWGAVLDIGTVLPPGHPGTSHYRAPERLAADSVANERMEVFSLGVILYELLVGYPPFARHAADVFDPMGDLVATAMQNNEPDPPSALVNFRPQETDVRCGDREESPSSLRDLLVNGLDQLALRAVAKDRIHSTATNALTPCDLPSDRTSFAKVSTRQPLRLTRAAACTWEGRVV